MSSAFLWLLIFLLAILIPACASSTPAFHMTYSAYKLNKQGDNIQAWRTSFPNWIQFVVLCPVLTVASWPTYRFLRGQVRWYGISISLRIFHSLLRSTQSSVSTQSCPTILRPMDCSPPGSSVHGILQAGILKWVSIPFSRGPSWLRHQTWVSGIGGRFFTIWATWEATNQEVLCKSPNHSVP